MTKNEPYQKFVQGYAQLLDAPTEAFFAKGFSLINTPLRDLPEWANWVQPIWLFGFEEAVICSVSPTYAEAAEDAFTDVTAATLLSDEMLARATSLAPDQEWVRCELFYYPDDTPPAIGQKYKVGQLRPGQPKASKHLAAFDGGVYVIWDENEEITSAAYVKNKGVIQEIAVGTEEAYRRQGRGEAVVAYAIGEILAQGHVPTYWPDSFENKGSYALAGAVGMVKVAEMLFCAYAEAEWQGFPTEQLGN